MVGPPEVNAGSKSKERCSEEDANERLVTGSASTACCDGRGEKAAIGSARAGELTQHRMSCERDLVGAGME